MTTRTRLSLVLCCLGLGLHPACRKAPPDEIVYTGAQSPTGGGTGGAALGGGGLPAGGTGGATSDAGGTAGGFQGLGGAAPDVPFTKRALLEQIADCARGEYAAFHEAALTLRDEADGFQKDATPENAQSARDAWTVAIARWQEAELFRFGPAARTSEPGGQDLRDQIYAWPLVNRCKIEEQLVAKTYATPGFPTSLVNARGLAAIEYLLFYPGTDNACSQFSSINGGSWAALGADLAIRKTEYASAAALDVSLRSAALVSAWDPAAGNFRAQLVNAGSGSTVYSSDQAALNAVSNALFYIEIEVKDQKLGHPLGLIDCFQPTCPEDVESRYAKQSTQHIKANLLAFRRMFEGCYADGAGLGFDDWLKAAGASDIADGMVQDLAGARAAVDALDPPLEQALLTDPAKAKVVFDAIKKLTDVLKTEFVTALNLELPMVVDGDND